MDVKRAWVLGFEFQEPAPEVGFGAAVDAGTRVHRLGLARRA